MYSVPLSLVDFTVLRSCLPLFEPLSLTLIPGKACEIWGGNGIGKTSFLEALVGLHNDFQGEITFPSASSFYVSTNAPYDGSETVENNLLFWKKIWKTPDLSLQNALDFWHLIPLKKLPYETLSDGQKQRVNLARLFLKPSTIWLLDEPTRHLDKSGSELLWKALRAHLCGGGIALIATHQKLEIDSQKITLHPSFSSLKKDVS